MAPPSLALAVGLLALARTITALQVSPNSPCASVCIDSSSLDVSDPNSSTTTNDDIVCSDADFLNTDKGKKFKSCMTCLQGSDYSQGIENDQMWFLYNLRYAFDYCIFAYPNASDIGLGPCSTSTACGSLEGALTSDSLDAGTLAQYGYCNANDSAMTGESYGKCLTCITADHDQSYLANFLIALEAGCLQKPAVGKVVGLNDTIFAATEIGIVDPNSVKTGGGDSAAGQHQITPQTIIGIVVGVVVLLLIVTAVLFIRHRKRRGRKEYKSKGHRPASSLSFRCQTHLSPVSSPRMFTSPEAATAPSPYTDEKSVFDGVSPVSPASAWSQAYNRQYSQQHLRDLTKPSPVHANSKASLPERPAEELNSTTPASATSTKSTQNLLPLATMRPYVPADYAPMNPYQQSPISARTSPSLRGWSPMDYKKDQGAWGELPTQKTDRKSMRQSRIDPLGIYTKNSANSLNGSPVETLELQMNFKGPPARG